MAEWVGEAEIDLAEGGRYLIRWANSNAVMDATISALDPPHLLHTDSMAVSGGRSSPATPARS